MPPPEPRPSATSNLPTAFRDVHTLTQHAFGSAQRFESVGGLMLGSETDWGFFPF